MRLTEEQIEKRKDMVNRTIRNLHELKRSQIEATTTRGFESIEKAHEFTKFVILIQVTLVSLGIPLIASGEKIGEHFILAAATVLFSDIIIGVLILRRNISFELDFNPKLLDELENNIDNAIQELQVLRNSINTLDESDFLSKYKATVNSAKWTEVKKEKFNWDVLFYGLFILGLVLLWLSIFWNPIIVSKVIE